jgi:regulator of protease activity HflC (stomatin/prohibitin superfamily)
MLYNLLALAVLVVFVLLLVRRLVRSVTVYQYELGLKYTRGRFAGVLPPGLYWYVPQFSTVRKVDVRPTFVTISGQEVLSADGVSLRVSLAARYQVTQPDLAINQSDNYAAALYLELQVALRQIIGGAPIDDLLGQRAEFGQQLLELVAPKAEQLGLRLLDAEIKDIMFPGELKRVFTQVVKARQEGLAALEKARGETAALRNLANAAQLVERNPAILQLRMLQAIGQSGGNTVVMGMPPQSTTIPIRAGQPEEPEPRQLPPESEQ